jgi:hypothetical protein
LVVSLSLVLLSGVVILATGGNEEIVRTAEPAADMPPEKDALLRGAVDLEGELANPPVVTLMAAFPDTGDATTIAAVKTSMVAHMAADNAVYRAPLTEDAIAERLGEPLAAIWSQAAQAVQYDQHYKALKLLLGENTNYEPFEDNRFVIDQWQGVRVNGASAFCLATAHDEVQRSGVWEAADSQQYQVSMVFEDGAWKLNEVQMVQLNP